MLALTRAILARALVYADGAVGRLPLIAVAFLSFLWLRCILGAFAWASLWFGSHCTEPSRENEPSLGDPVWAGHGRGWRENVRGPVRLGFVGCVLFVVCCLFLLSPHTVSGRRCSSCPLSLLWILNPFAWTIQVWGLHVQW